MDPVRKFFSFPCFLFFLFYAHCQFPVRKSPSPPWPKVKALRAHSFRIYLDPEIKRDWLKIIEAKALLRDKMIKLYFPYLKKEEGLINLVLYKKEKLYSKYAFFRKHPHVRSYFIPSAYSIHIPLQAEHKLWVHEFSHALLEKARPGSPRWLHEGLAGFLSQRKVLVLAKCQASIEQQDWRQGKPQENLQKNLRENSQGGPQKGSLKSDAFKQGSSKIKIPKHIGQRAPTHSFWELQKLFKKKKGWGSFRYHESSALLFYYLWSRKKMRSYILEYQKGTKAGKELLLESLKEKSTYSLLKNFYLWLRHPKLKEELAGC